MEAILEAASAPWDLLLTCLFWLPARRTPSWCTAWTSSPALPRSMWRSPSRSQRCRQRSTPSPRASAAQSPSTVLHFKDTETHISFVTCDMRRNPLHPVWWRCMHMKPAPCRRALRHRRISPAAGTSLRTASNQVLLPCAQHCLQCPQCWQACAVSADQAHRRGDHAVYIVAALAAGECGDSCVVEPSLPSRIVHVGI